MSLPRAPSNALSGMERAFVHNALDGCVAIYIEGVRMLKRMSVVICGLAVMLLTAGVASAQTATQDAKDKTKTAADKTAKATKNAAKKTVTVLTDAESRWTGALRA